MNEKKMLHERLRGIDAYCLADIASGAPTRCQGDCKKCGEDARKALADEIERDYIPRTDHEAEVKRIIEAQGDRHDGCGPSAHHIMKTYADKVGMPMENETITEWLDRWFISRPLFEDGEPMQWDDEFKTDSIGTFLTTVCYCIGGDIVLNELAADDEHKLVLEPGEFVKRPTPKVLDADGVEIKVGDTVYEVRTGYKSTVKRTDSCNSDGKPVVCKEYGAIGELWYKPEELTHERPIFDADGVPIRKGDTVWHITRGEKHTVEHVDGEDGGIFIEGYNSIFSGVEFTHREPDSLEQLRDDFSSALDECDRYVDEEFQEKYQRIFERLTALIERGA